MAERAFLNRELSWLEFNKRVLEEALDQSVPLLERVKFLSIFSTNLDEFFMVRVAGLKRRIEEREQEPGPDGLTPEETLVAISERVHQLVEQQHDCFLDEIQPRLAAEGVRVVRPSEINEEHACFLEDYFRRTLRPVLTPLAIDPGHPFPHLANRALCFVVSLSQTTANLNISWRRRTGCQEISTAVWKLHSQCSTPPCKSSFWKSSRCNLLIRSRRMNCYRMDARKEFKRKKRLPYGHKNACTS